MKPDDLTIEVLKEIRDEGRKTNERLNDTNSRLDQMRDELSRRIVESEMRTATALTELAMSVKDVAGLLRAQNDLKPRLEKCEEEIEKLKRRLPDA
jgi:chromosome segregation ATPase